jgi:beta-glucanase (GH16 family)
MNRSTALLSGALLILPGVLQAQTWSQTWSDEFNGTGAVNGVDWKYDVGGGGWGNNELQYYQSGTGNVNQAGGIMTVQARLQSVGGMAYTSGRILTQGLRSFGPGDTSAKKIEARMAGPAGQGLWPAFWMLGTNIQTAPWPACGEIDILEHINNVQNAYGTIHWGDTASPPNHLSYQAAAPAMTTFNSYHTYGLTWDANALTWYLDGANVGAANIAGNINNTGAFHKSFFILFNLAVGGSWPGNPDASTAMPANMNVDYVRYSQAGTAPTATATTAPRPTATPTARARATATATSSGCSGFTQGVVNSGTTTALPWFKLCTGTASYVILHYNVSGGAQQNVNMTYNATSARWELSVTGMAAGRVLNYQFTYNTGSQLDSAWFAWTHP